MQLGLFDSAAGVVSLGDAVLFALGEFQSRGHELADRELALDRLRHAIDRSCDKFRLGKPSDEVAAELLEKAGAKVVEIPNYFAKRPYRITVPASLAASALSVYHQMNGEHS